MPKKTEAPQEAAAGGEERSEPEGENGHGGIVCLYKEISATHGCDAKIFL